MDIIDQFIKRQQYLITFNNNRIKYQNIIPYGTRNNSQTNFLTNEHIQDSIDIFSTLKSESNIDIRILHFMLIKSINVVINILKYKFSNKDNVWYEQEYVLAIERSKNTKHEIIIKGSTILQCIIKFWDENLNAVYYDNPYKLKYVGEYINGNSYQPGDVVIYNHNNEYDVYYARHNTTLFPSHTCDMYDWDLL